MVKEGQPIMEELGGRRVSKTRDLGDWVRLELHGAGTTLSEVPLGARTVL